MIKIECIYQPQSNEILTVHKVLVDKNSHRYYYELKSNRFKFFDIALQGCNQMAKNPL